MNQSAVGSRQSAVDADSSASSLLLPTADRRLPTRIAVLTPLPPTKSGVAHYSSLVLPALAKAADVQAFDSLDGYRREEFDHVLYQLGNNPHHEVMFAEAMREPGVIVLHDLVLHHLIVEMTLARGDAESYVAALEASHGAAGAAWGRGRAAGLHSEMGNFLLPASVEVANRSHAVIVHNAYARDRLRSFGVQTPIHLVPHPYVPETRRFDREGLRARYGFEPTHRVIGFFGFLTSAKRAEVVLEAFRIARARDSRLALLIVGEPAPNIDLAALRGEGILTTGYVADEDFPAYYAVADRFVNLRYPSAGETSGTLIRAFDAGKPVAVSDYAQFAEFPADCAFRVPLGEGEIERLVEFFTRDFDDVSVAQRAWLEANARLDLTVQGYLNALSPSPRRAGRGQGEGLPLFPQLQLVNTLTNNERLYLTLRNAGSSTIKTRTYGSPEYRLIAKLFDGDRVVHDRWLALPCDLRPGETATIELPLIANATTLRLYHAIQDIPSPTPEPFEVARVR